MSSSISNAISWIKIFWPWSVEQPINFHSFQNSIVSRAKVGSPKAISLFMLSALLQTVLLAGNDIPSALRKLSFAISETASSDSEKPQQVEELLVVASRLQTGSNWQEAWHGSPASLVLLSEALAESWKYGVASEASMVSLQTTLLTSAQNLIEVESEKLSVRMVLPIGLCFLPAFILLGVLPVVVSVVS